MSKQQSVEAPKIMGIYVVMAYSDGTQHAVMMTAKDEEGIQVEIKNARTPK